VGPISADNPITVWLGQPHQRMRRDNFITARFKNAVEALAY
jgi:hypothetical protein